MTIENPDSLIEGQATQPTIETLTRFLFPDVAEIKTVEQAAEKLKLVSKDKVWDIYEAAHGSIREEIERLKKLEKGLTNIGLAVEFIDKGIIQ